MIAEATPCPPLGWKAESGEVLRQNDGAGLQGSPSRVTSVYQDWRSPSRRHPIELHIPAAHPSRPLHPPTAVSLASMQVTEEAAVAKPSEVCQACKVRHRKCDFQEDGCLQCRNAGIACVRQPSLKFRYHPMQKALSRAPPSVWRPCPLPRAPARFHDETPELRAIYHHQEGPLPPPRRQRHLSFSHASSGQDSLAENVSGGSVASSHVQSQCPEDSASLEHPMDDTSPFSEPFLGEPSPSNDHCASGCPPLTPIEALLVRNFTDHMAQWTDIADPFRTFETVISQLALTDLIIRNAICAFSARHFYRCQDNEDGGSKALDYQNRCIKLLIPAMSGGQKITESVLTAVALLRQNEEMDGQ